MRIENRIGGADLNPYLAMASQLAAGLSEIEEGLDLPPATLGDVYRGRLALLPTKLRDARTALVKSNMLRRLFGYDVAEHYARAAEWEIEEFNRVVTDYEVARGFERA